MAANEQTSNQVRLTTERILRAAIEIADARGIEGLSMRKLADELDAAPMALYRHVANKEELLDGMVDVVYGEVEVPRGLGWRKAMWERAVSMRRALLRHPWAIGLMEPRTPGIANLRYHDAVMACLREEARLPFRTAIHAYSVMDSYIYGFALQEKTLPADVAKEAETRREAVAERDVSLAEEFPYLSELVVELGASGYDYSEEFEFGLELILDGIERLRRRR